MKGAWGERAARAFFCLPPARMLQTAFEQGCDNMVPARIILNGDLFNLVRKGFFDVNGFIN